MKKKVCFSILFVLFTASLLGGCGIFHWRGEIPDYEEQLYTCQDAAEIHDIVIDNQDVPVEIYTSRKEDIYFSYYLADDESNRYEIEEKNGRLNISNKCRPNYGIFIFGDESTSESYKDVKLQLHIPADYSGNLSVKAYDGNISVYDITVENLKIETGDGDVLFDDTDIEKVLYCRTGDGAIGGILAGNESEYNFKVKTADHESSVKSSGESNKTVELVTDDGDINISFNGRNSIDFDAP